MEQAERMLWLHRFSSVEMKLKACWHRVKPDLDVVKRMAKRKRRRGRVLITATAGRVSRRHRRRHSTSRHHRCRRRD